MSTIVRHTRDHRGMKSSRCPRCNTLFAYWDETDLDEHGDLRCYCDGVDENEPDVAAIHQAIIDLPYGEPVVIEPNDSPAHVVTTTEGR